MSQLIVKIAIFGGRDYIYKHFTHLAVQFPVKKKKNTNKKIEAKIVKGLVVRPIQIQVATVSRLNPVYWISIRPTG